MTGPKQKRNQVMFVFVDLHTSHLSDNEKQFRVSKCLISVDDFQANY